MNNSLQLNKSLAFLAGVYFAFLQFAYYFMLEAFLTSRSISFFIALLFWLIGFLIGLNIKKNGLLITLLFAGTITYYCGFFLNQLFLYNKNLLFIISIFIIVSGISPGYFFSKGGGSFAKIKDLFFHENNGFILGILISLPAILFYGSLFLKIGPAVGFILFMMAYYFYSMGTPKEENI